jgi:phosphocarrier protein HPr
MKPLRQTFTIKNARGLHARAAAMLVQAAERRNASVYLYRDNLRADCKSILSVLTLACPQDSEITVEAVGEDAADVLEEIGRLIEHGFGEDGHDQ